MHPNALFPELYRVHPAADITDLVSGAMAGDRVNMALFEQCTIMVQKSDGTSGQDPVITVQQHDAASGGNSKALNFDEYYVASHASDLTANLDAFTKSDNSADEQITLDGETEYLVLIPIRAEMLDVDNGYQFVNVGISDPGATGSSYAAAFYLLGNPRYLPAYEQDVRS